MARIRTIKPEFWQDEKLAGCSDKARLLAIAILQLCDANGVFRNIPMQIHAHAFPWEAEVNTPALLRELEGIGYVNFYRVDGRAYGHVPGFTRHQRLQGKEAGSNGQFPLPDQADSEEEAPDNSQGSNGEYPDDSPGDTGTGNREQGTGKGNRPKRKTVLATHELFDRWYRVYPNKKARAQALKAWGRLKPNRQLTARMIRAVRLQVRWRAAKNRAGQFVPEWKHPATWLNNECWTDELDWPQRQTSREMVMEGFD